MTAKEFNLETYLEALKPLVNIDCGTSTPAGVAKIADMMTEKYESIGWQVAREDFGEQVGPGLLVTNNPDTDQFDIMLIGHMDTVFPEGTVAEWSLTNDGEKAYGPGCADMKSGLLNIFLAVSSLPADVLDRLNIAVVMNPDEETGSTFSDKWLMAIAQKSKCVLVAEAARADGSLVKARKGMAHYVVEFNGKAAHAGNEPENGVSAITELAHWISTLNQETNFETGTTLNFGTVRGGTGSNVVPDFAATDLDIRFWDNDAYAALEEKIAEMVANPSLEGISINLTRKAYKPAFTPNADSEKLMALIEETGKEIDLPITWQAVGGGSDANLTGSLGIPTVDGLGPIGGAMHSRNEFMVLDSIAKRLELLRNVIINIAERG
ncbi:peptidase M20 [Endozoicomonas montiporae]|uniref:Peptidase M20 n=2 Tax=Endozoicomonas montiporae TaxID=1027273 RepID=A0A081N8H2_9GAMM|nr:M20 family metallopeptidase [Endozoicomonas montiporae]AMO55358.1 carboxypeptidase G2 [Endozoicomonas montiporae CL-33]KEQ14745.1 peptidase M20 [Endozoicomonas montiporae]